MHIVELRHPLVEYWRHCVFHPVWRFAWADHDEALVSEEARTWCRPTTKLLHGKPYEEILSFARHNAVDLIVMGVHGRNPDRVAFSGTSGTP